MCEYCENCEPIVDVEEPDYHLWAYISNKDLVTGFEVGEEMDELFTPIIFCPMCGKKLTEDEGLDG